MVGKFELDNVHVKARFISWPRVGKGLKGHYVVLKNSFKVRIVFIFMIQCLYFYNSINKLFTGDNKVPRTQFEARKVAGVRHM